MMLVTGGAGYLGSCLARTLIAKGETVRILDLKMTKYVPAGAEFLAGDMRDARIVAQAVAGAEAVFHLAFVQSMSKLPESERRDINIRGTQNVLDAGAAAGVRRLVFGSTIEIYGTRPPFPCREDAATDEPVGWYGRHKLECERMVWRSIGDHGLAASVVRMPTICGPGFYNHRPVLNFMERIIDGKTLAVVGDGSTPGHFVHYLDCLDGLQLAARHPAAVGQAFNISAKEPSTQLQIMEAMIAAVGSRSKIIKIPRWIVRPFLETIVALRITDFPRDQFGYLLYPNVYSNEKAARLLDYRPSKTTAEAAADLIAHYLTDREYLKNRSENY